MISIIFILQCSKKVQNNQISIVATRLLEELKREWKWEHSLLTLSEVKVVWLKFTIVRGKNEFALLVLQSTHSYQAMQFYFSLNLLKIVNCFQATCIMRMLPFVSFVRHISFNSVLPDVHACLVLNFCWCRLQRWSKPHWNCVFQDSRDPCPQIQSSHFSIAYVYNSLHFMYVEPDLKRRMSDFQKGKSFSRRQRRWRRHIYWWRKCTRPDSLWALPSTE